MSEIMKVEKEEQDADDLLDRYFAEYDLHRYDLIEDKVSALVENMNFLHKCVLTLREKVDRINKHIAGKYGKGVSR